MREPSPRAGGGNIGAGPCDWLVFFKEDEMIIALLIAIVAILLIGPVAFVRFVIECTKWIAGLAAVGGVILWIAYWSTS